MPVYEYKGLDTAGKNVKGMIDAESKAALRQLLQSKGVFVTDVVEGRAAIAIGVSIFIEHCRYLVEDVGSDHSDHASWSRNDLVRSNPWCCWFSNRYGILGNAVEFRWWCNAIVF